MQTLTIEAVKKIPGKMFVLKTNEGDFLAELGSGIESAVGKKIDADIKSSHKDGKSYHWIKDWIAISSPAPQLQHPETGKTPTYPASTQAPSWQPMASNVVAACIEKGLISTPHQIKEWVDAVKAAI